MEQLVKYSHVVRLHTQIRMEPDRQVGSEGATRNLPIPRHGNLCQRSQDIQNKKTGRDGFLTEYDNL